MIFITKIYFLINDVPFVEIVNKNTLTNGFTKKSNRSYKLHEYLKDGEIKNYNIVLIDTNNKIIMSPLIIFNYFLEG